MVEKLLSLLKESRISDLMDIGLMSVLLYVVIVWFKKMRSLFVLIGILIFGFVYLVAYEFNLYLTTSVLQGFFAVILIALIIIFQEELRSLFERTAVWSLRKQEPKAGLLKTQSDFLVRTLLELSRRKIGAIIVIKGKDLIGRYLEGGYDLDGIISEPLLLSLFDPHSPGHDGAMIIDTEKIIRFGCHLPLSKNFQNFHGKGTRHAAALGLSEKCDAFCLVVSEERGTISGSLHGEIFEIENESHLRQVLERFLLEMTPSPNHSKWRRIQKNFPEKVTAIVIASLLWFVVVHESKFIIRTFKIPVEYFEEVPNLRVAQIEPEDVVATFSGPQNIFHFLSEKNIRLTVKLSRKAVGTEVIPITRSDFNFPQEINLENIEPHSVKITLERK